SDSCRSAPRCRFRARHGNGKDGSVRRRPNIYRPVPRFVGIVILCLLAASLLGPAWGVGLAIFAVAWFGGTWLLAPYSEWAWRIHQPPVERLERWRERARRTAELPVIGRLFRFGQAATGNAGEKMSAD